MHEMSLMMSIWDGVKEEVETQGYRNVHRIEIEVGDVLGVVDEFLQTCFEALKQEESVIQHAQLVIRHTPTLVRCNRCKNEWSYDDHWYYCDQCGISDSDIVTGKGLSILTLDVD